MRHLFGGWTKESPNLRLCHHWLKARGDPGVPVTKQKWPEPSGPWQGCGVAHWRVLSWGPMSLDLSFVKTTWLLYG